ncbi:RNA polymerase sigma factor [Paraburkholderia sp.]|uniref:RNA polymerase sigma factor n=1 Tax=Paraburkholderia sp. TaxID=1926495 RepID=UPI002390D8C2|nr:RNA polymerase sigma factor [Paraburkholderia sp.]MDE1181015.1 RNA polymerase sigma factor [Paraburkholderia sp.]
MGRQASARFEELMLPYLDSAYNLARWLSGTRADADDLVQEAYLRALRYFDGYSGDTPRAWLLAIVRNTWFTEWNRRAQHGQNTSFDEAVHGDIDAAWSDAPESNPETLAVRHDEIELVRDALRTLAVEYREVLVLRELEDMSYREVAAVVGIPIGTVMSRLSRARALLATAVRAAQNNGPHGTGVRLVKAPPTDPEKSRHGN